jgi:hypothetical protein
MRKLATSALAAAVLAAGAGVEAQAQDDMMGRRASAFDLGIYGGGAWSTDWFEIGDNGFAPELSPIFGATAAFFFTPTIGLRLHGAYMPQHMPENEDVRGADFDFGYVVNSWLYDLDLVFRPWVAREDASNWMASTYFFLGGGGYTANIAGESRYPGCLNLDGWLANGVCVTDRPSLSTTGQGVVGFGVDMFPIGSALALFIEGAVHGYDSPAHVNENAQNAEDKITFTPRLVLGLKAMFGNLIPPPPPPPAVIPPPPPPVIAPPPPPPPVVQPTRDIRVCVVENGMLREITAVYNTQTGDTTVNGQRIPATTGYAAGATWYINNEPITVNGRRYVRYGLPRVLGVNEVTRTAEYQGVSVFAEAGAQGTPEVLYIPVRPGCEFQPYQLEVKAGGVRGE